MMNRRNRPSAQSSCWSTAICLRRSVVWRRRRRRRLQLTKAAAPQLGGVQFSVLVLRRSVVQVFFPFRVRGGGGGVGGLRGDRSSVHLIRDGSFLLRVRTLCVTGGCSSRCRLVRPAGFSTAAFSPRRRQRGDGAEVVVDVQHGGVQQGVDVLQTLQSGLEASPAFSLQLPQLLLRQPGKRRRRRRHG